MVNEFPKTKLRSPRRHEFDSREKTFASRIVVQMPRKDQRAARRGETCCVDQIFRVRGTDKVPRGFRVGSCSWLGERRQHFGRVNFTGKRRGIARGEIRLTKNFKVAIQREKLRYNRVGIDAREGDTTFVSCGNKGCDSAAGGEPRGLRGVEVEKDLCSYLRRKR